MSSTLRACLGGVFLLALATAACALIPTHIDCTQVAQQQRAGQSNQEIASSMDRSVDDVQSCSDTTPRREASNSDYDQPLLPDLPSSMSTGAAGGVASASITGGIGLH